MDSPRKSETFRNFSMILDRQSKIKSKPIGIEPMIKSNGFSEFKLNKIKVDKNRSSIQSSSL
jgi:hypothetical protein